MIAEHAIKVGARVIHEWPDGCLYWDDPDYVEFFEKHGFKHTRFDGCMYGLVAAFGKGKGLPIKKPWRIACVNTCLPELLNKTCCGTHQHTPCEGKDTLHSQGYTVEIVKVIHQAINRDLQLIDKAKAAPAKGKRNFLHASFDLWQFCDLVAKESLNPSAARSLSAPRAPPL